MDPEERRQLARTAGEGASASGGATGQEGVCSRISICCLGTAVLTRVPGRRASVRRAAEKYCGGSPRPVLAFLSRPCGGPLGVPRVHPGPVPRTLYVWAQSSWAWTTDCGFSRPSRVFVCTLFFFLVLFSPPLVISLAALFISRIFSLRYGSPLVCGLPPHGHLIAALPHIHAHPRNCYTSDLAYAILDNYRCSRTIYLAATQHDPCPLLPHRPPRHLCNICNTHHLMKSLTRHETPSAPALRTSCHPPQPPNVTISVTTPHCTERK